MSSKTDNLYKPNLNIDKSNDEWNIVEKKTKERKINNSRTKLEDKKKRNMEYRLKKAKNDYLSKIDDFMSKMFVKQLLDQRIEIRDNELKAKVNKLLSDIENNFEKLDTAKSFGFFNNMKFHVENNSKKLNALVNKDNLYLLVGNDKLYKDQQSLKNLDEYKLELDKFKLSVKAKEVSLVKKTDKNTYDFNSCKIVNGKSYASII
jgi:hypothetical protein